MKIIRELLFLVVFTFILTSCNAVSSDHSLSSQPLSPVKSNNEVLSPFIQFENLKKGEDLGIDREQVDNILRSYGIYDKVLAKVHKEDYTNLNNLDVRIDGYNIGNKKVALLGISKGHIYIYVLLSNNSDKWLVNGFVCQNERYKPEYRVEQSIDKTKYWLVVRHEANHGTGLQIFDEIWYNPDGSVAGEYPVEGSTLFFPQIVEPEANTYFSASAADYDGDYKINLSYSISFEYGYKDNSQDLNRYRFQSKYSPAIEYWEYDLKTRQLKFISCDPALPQSFTAMKHSASSEYAILQGYIDFYGTRLGDKKITTLEEWEKFMGLD